jgi:hypothetical protein
VGLCKLAVAHSRVDSQADSRSRVDKDTAVERNQADSRIRAAACIPVGGRSPEAMRSPAGARIRVGRNQVDKAGQGQVVALEPVELVGQSAPRAVAGQPEPL